MQTDSPDNFASCYSCGICGVMFQVLEPVVDENFAAMFREDGSQMFYNNEPVASEELNEHIRDEHASP